MFRDVVAAKYAWTGLQRDYIPVTRMRRSLKVSRTRFCRWQVSAPFDRAHADAALDAQVAALHSRSKRSDGRSRIVRALQQQGMSIGHKRVRKSRKRLRLRASCRRPYRVTTHSKRSKPITPNVLARRFDGGVVNRTWASDITYVRTTKGRLHLVFVMGLASRRIVGWLMSEGINADLVCRALGSAYWRRKPDEQLIIYSDCGSEYASDAYRKVIKDFRIVQSKSRKANYWDNSAMESVFKSLKVERIYQFRYETRRQARLDGGDQGRVHHSGYLHC